MTEIPRTATTTGEQRIIRRLFDLIFSRELQEKLKESPIIILTASVVVDPGLTKHQKDLVLSRAHLSMAEAFAQLYEDKEGNRPPVVDICSYLLSTNSDRMRSVGQKGQLVARSSLLRKAHELTAPILRRSLPLEDYLRPETEALIEKIVNQKSGSKKPIVTFHYAVGNIAIEVLSRTGRQDIPVIHYITDPYVHPNYLKHKDLPFVYYFTFDEKTRLELIKQGVSQERVFFIGFPLAKNLEVKVSKNNLELVANQYNYFLEGRKKLRVGIFTGGLGGNQDEILTVAQGLDYRFQQGVFYCGTNEDLKIKLEKIFRKKGIKYKIVKEADQNLEFGSDDQAVIIFGESLEGLLPLSYQALNWSQVVCSKPSGDIGIESLLAGKLFIPFANWGKHEENIRQILQEMKAIVPIKTLATIGSELFEFHKNKGLVKQILELWNNLIENSVFPYDWRERVKAAFDKLHSPLPI